jgi:hypothetical protein
MRLITRFGRMGLGNFRAIMHTRLSPLSNHPTTVATFPVTMIRNALAAMSPVGTHRSIIRMPADI